DDGTGWHAGLDGEVAPLACRLEIGGRRGRAVAVADGVLPAAKSFLLSAVVVVADRHPGRLRRLDPGAVNGILGLCELGADRARAPAPGVLAALPRLAALEIRKHVGVGPAARALLRPAVVVAAMSAGIGQRVDGG